MMKILSWLRILAAAALLLGANGLAFALDYSTHQQDFLWQPFPGNFPPGVLVFQGRAQSANGEPIRAWYADIDLKRARLRPFLSDSPIGKEGASKIALKSGALLAVNGGYFDMQSKPARTFSMVRRDGQGYAQNINRVSRPTGGGTAFFPIARSAIGWNEDGKIEFAWLWQDGEVTRRAPTPFLNAPGVPAILPTAEQVAAWPVWDVQHALGGGPRLLENGEPRVTYDEEVFFGSGFRGDVPYPRTAIGQTAEGHAILFVTDGKNILQSIGLTLPQLADELKKLGCVDAMNLDGGGSSAFVVEGHVVNIPSDGQERAVTSILGVFPKLPVSPA